MPMRADVQEGRDGAALVPDQHRRAQQVARDVVPVERDLVGDRDAVPGRPEQALQLQRVLLLREVLVGAQDVGQSPSAGQHGRRE